MKLGFVRIFKASFSRFDREEKKRAFIVLHIAISLILFSLLFIGFNHIFGLTHGTPLNWMLAALVIVQIPVLWALRAGSVNQAILILLTAAWMMITILNRLLGGVHDIGIFGYFLIQLSSVVLLDWRYTTAYTTASILAVWWLAYLEKTNSWRQTWEPQNRWLWELAFSFC